VVDGQSEDGTREIVFEFSKRHPWIRFLDNVRRIVPAAMNIGIQSAKGQIVIRMDAHTVYPANYVSGLVQWLVKSKADNVGGICITLPANQTPEANAIAFALSHPLGVGNGYFRIGAAEPKWVDTVPYGCYRKQVFHQVGLFNENLIRNQDIEFNLRLKRRGGKILLVPAIVSYYSARSTIKDFLKQSFANGFWVIYGAGFTHLPFSVRHVVPLLWVGSLMTLSAAAFYNQGFIVVALLMLTLYLAVSTAVSVHLAWSRGMKTCLCLIAAFGTLHFGYGAGSLWGLVKLGQLKANKKRY